MFPFTFSLKQTSKRLITDDTFLCFSPRTGFLDDEHHLTSLQETLNLVAAPELKLLVKSLHISTGKKGSSKEDIIETIISLADNQKTLFGSFKSVVLKRYNVELYAQNKIDMFLSEGINILFVNRQCSYTT